MPRRANARAGESLPTEHHDPLSKYTRHRAFNSAIARQLYQDSDTIDVGRRIANCATVLGLDLYEDEGQELETQIRSMRPCNARLCPFCEWRRTRAWRKRLFSGLEAFNREHPKYVPLFLTLTVPNPRMEDLRDTLKQMNAAWHRMTASSAFPTEYWFRRTEVTVGSTSPESPLMAHPHFHVLLLVRPSYFGKHYIKQVEWQKRWTNAMRSDVSLVVDVRRVRSQSSSSNESMSGSELQKLENANAVLEVAKYMSKATQLVEMGDALSEFHRQMGGLKLFTVSKSLRGFISEGLIQEDEMLDANDHLAEGRAPDARAIAQWFDDTQEYVFTSIT